MDPKQLLKTAATPKEALRLGFLAFGVLGFLQMAGRADLVGADPMFGPGASIALSILCLVLLEVYTYVQRGMHLEEQAELVENGTKPPKPVV